MATTMSSQARGPEGTRGGDVEVAPGLRFPKAGVEVPVDDHPTGLALRVGVTADGGRLVVDRLEVEQQPGGPPVTLAALQQIALGNYVKLAARAHLRGLDGPHYEEAVFWGFLTYAERERIKAEGPNDWTLRKIAELYRVAVALGEPPAKSIHNALGQPPSLRTVSNWIAAARKAGHLVEPADKE